MTVLDLAAPLDGYRITVPADWIDENDHMDTMQYKTAADGGTRALLDTAGITREGLESNGGTLFQLEMHIVYERELRLGAPLLVRSWLIGSDAKRIHHFHEILHETGRFRAASVELMTIHVDRETRRSAPMPGEWVERLSTIRQAHARLPQPGKVSSRISLERV
jgi:acyl-CoA thioester hydrolase